MDNNIGDLVADGDGANLLDLELSLLPKNDYGNSIRFIKRYGEDLMFVRDVGWHRYVDGCWQHMGAVDYVKRMASYISPSIIDEVAALQSTDGTAFFKEKMKGIGDYRDFIDKLFGWSNKSGNGPQINAITRIIEPELTIDTSQIDTHKNLLNLKNGTMVLNKHCIDLQDHNRGDYITKQLDVEYIESAKCPEFIKFIERVLPDEDVRLFIQTYMGYCLTGEISEQIFIFMYGGGSNGKSVLIDIIARILGKYSQSLNFDSFADNSRKRGGDATPDLATLPGARMVRVSEIKKNEKLAEATVKQVTGGEAMSVRHLNKGFFSFYPEFKLILSGNHKPQITGNDHGIWRRICLVNFNVKIPRDERDVHLPEKLWKERSGILNWLLDGCQMWHAEQKLKIPNVILKETEEYRSESDPMSVFILDELIYEPGGETSLKDIYQRFKKWGADTSRANEWKAITVSRALKERTIKYNDEEIAIKSLSIRAHGNSAYFKDIVLIERNDDEDD